MADGNVSTKIGKPDFPQRFSGYKDLPRRYKFVGQPVFIGGSMGVGSFVLAGIEESEDLSFGSACHGAGRSMSRTKARKLQGGEMVTESLREQGIIVRSGSFRGVAEEAPEAYKSLDAVVNCAEQAGLAKKVARLAPHICVKG